MRKSALLLVVGAVIAVHTADPVRAQVVGTEQCDSVRANGSATYKRELGVSWLGGGTFFQCPGGVTIQADSAVLTEPLGLAEFIGAVRYADSTRVLVADWAQYQQDQASITARGNVTLIDRSSGTMIRHAPLMTYYQATETRPEGLIVIPSGRPEAVLVRAGAAGAPPDTTNIVADQLNIYGDNRFLARGEVEITRADVRGTASEAEYSGEASELRLYGRARLTGQDYELAGDTILALTDEAERLREVFARGSGELDSSGTEVRVSAPLLRILLNDGEVERLIAVVPAEMRGTAPTVVTVADRTDDAAGAGEIVRARAESSEFAIFADSIDAVTPARQLEHVTAVGRAFAEHLDADSVRAGLLQQLSAAQAAVLAKDWVSGDTVVATFVDSTDQAATDKRVVDRITAIGSEPAPASAVAMVRSDPNDGGEPGFCYQVALQIQIHFTAGQVGAVESAGGLQGICVQPEDAARAFGSRTARQGGGR